MSDHWPGPLRHAPALYVHTAQHEVTRVDMLTIGEARAVILRLCDELESSRLELLELKRARRDA